MRQVILNADDLGYDPAVTEGILAAMRQGVVSSATLMVNTPFSRDAALLADGLSLGLHLNLVKWSALSTGLEMSEHFAWTAEAVARETLDQVAAFKTLCNRRPTHIDVHKHWHRLPSVLEGVVDVAKAAHLPVRSIDASMRQRLRHAGVLTNDHFIGDAPSTAFWTLEQFEQVLRDLPMSGVVELMCHPGLVPTVISSRYAAQRAVELQTFTSERAAVLMREYEVECVGWKSALDGMQ